MDRKTQLDIRHHFESDSQVLKKYCGHFVGGRGIL